VVDYVIPVGPEPGRRIRLGFVVPPDFPLTPPSGPYVSPRLGHPHGAVNEAPQFGPDWEYWSRPFPGWQLSDRSVRTYIAHIRHLFQQR
jgi:hypothetical protein